jgi:hypothetical protein
MEGLHPEDDDISTDTELEMEQMEEEAADSQATEADTKDGEILELEADEDEELESVEDSEFEVEVDTEDDEDEHVDLRANERKSSRDSLCLFTTGLGFSAVDKSRLRAVIESAASKKKFLVNSFLARVF